MKVLIVNTYDIEGGAAKAAYRLHKGLQSIGIDSQMLVQFKAGDDYTVTGTLGRFQKYFARLRQQLDYFPVRRYRNRSPSQLFSPDWLPFSMLADRINAMNPDVVHLHWIANGYVHLDDIAKIKAPVVFSMHDNWLFTGGCHVKWDCQKYLDSCGSCPRLGSSTEHDVSRKGWQRKAKIFTETSNKTIIGLSQWIAAEAKKSSLLKFQNVVNLPNMLDVELFKPVDKLTARRIYNLPETGKIILFGAMDAASDVNKGFEYLQAALATVQSDHVQLVVFGCGKPKHQDSFTSGIHYVGRLHDDAALAVLYSAADVVIVPSLQENLSNTIMESLACGTPVVAFATGGNADLIDHQHNGYLATPFLPESLATGIQWVLEHEQPGLLSSNAREKVVNCFSVNKVAPQYESLYEDVLLNNTPV